MIPITDDLIFDYSHLIIDYSTSQSPTAKLIPYNTKCQYANLTMLISLTASKRAIESYKSLAKKYLSVNAIEAEQVLAEMNEVRIRWRKELDNYKRASLVFNAACTYVNPHTKRSNVLKISWRTFIQSNQKINGQKIKW